MNHIMFSIYDQKAEAFLPPFILPNKAMGIRVFSDCVNDKNHQFSKHPDDYTLFKIAEWDDSNSIFTYTESPVSMGNGVTFVGVNEYV